MIYLIFEWYIWYVLFVFEIYYVLIVIAYALYFSKENRDFHGFVILNDVSVYYNDMMWHVYVGLDC